MSKRNWALLGATFVAIIYGLTFTIAKDVMPEHVQPFGLILIRVLGATILFWLVSFFVPQEKIALKDFPRIMAASFFGVAFNQLTFFKGLSYTSPISASVIMVTAPIIVLILSAILIKERIELKKVLGIIIGLTGTAILILYGKSVGSATNANWGNFLVFVNAFSYGIYLILIKQLITKYNALSFIKWIYTFGLLYVIPFGYNEFSAINWNIMPTEIYYKIGYLVLFTTFLAYLINLMAMRHLKPTTLSVFIYLQPFFATIFAISMGRDSLNLIKIIAAGLIFVGVYLVTQKKELTSKN
ncbi:DMT family transporter [Flavobacterium chuncheonense]|uniref:DMT family transporter n=1 Tax=Flavobacterium chuncheonense TaxID=2026653 RepID=A0ABW5YNX6_9FLAO